MAFKIFWDNRIPASLTCNDSVFGEMFKQCVEIVHDRTMLLIWPTASDGSHCIKCSGPTSPIPRIICCDRLTVPAITSLDIASGWIACLCAVSATRGVDVRCGRPVILRGAGFPLGFLRSCSSFNTAIQRQYPCFPHIKPQWSFHNNHGRILVQSWVN